MKTPVTHPALVAAGFAAALVLSGSANAAGAVIDGKAGLICSVNDVTACTDSSQCLQGQARAFDLPQFIAVDFAAKKVRTTRDSGEKAASPIKNQQSSGNQILMQGVENGHGWTMAIDTTNGRMTTSSTGAEVSYILFGACIAP